MARTVFLRITMWRMKANTSWLAASVGWGSAAFTLRIGRLYLRKFVDIDEAKLGKLCGRYFVLGPPLLEPDHCVR